MIDTLFDQVALMLVLLFLLTILGDFLCYVSVLVFTARSRP